MFRLQLSLFGPSARLHGATQHGSACSVPRLHVLCAPVMCAGPGEAGSAQEETEALGRELALMARLDHPNVSV